MAANDHEPPRVKAGSRANQKKNGAEDNTVGVVNVGNREGAGSETEDDQGEDRRFHAAWMDLPLDVPSRRSSNKKHSLSRRCRRCGQYPILIFLGGPFERGGGVDFVVGLLVGVVPQLARVGRCPRVL